MNKYRVYGVVMVFLIMLNLVCIDEVMAMNESDNISPSYSVVPCPSNGKTKVTVLNRNNSSIYKWLNLYAAPGVTITVTQSYETTISNSANFSLFPELFQLGYSTSISAGNQIGWSKENKSNRVQQLVILKVYDNVRAISYSSVGSGNCRVDSNYIYSLARGWAFDLR